MLFPPVAVVGRGCVLPGALNPAALWHVVATGTSTLTRVPRDRWRTPFDRIVPAHAPHDIGGYVTGFEDVLDLESAAGAAYPVGTAARWVVHAAGQALREAGVHAVPEPSRSGLILGWLGLPDEESTSQVERAWRAGERWDEQARRRRTSQVADCARALGFGAGSLALDAACASSLYALEFACDRLHDGTADLMLAGGVSGADPLLIHTGFTALSALSPSGRSRPLHREADGLVPAEGAALVALMRPQDAAARGIRVLGLIRGIGLSNDGRGEGLLVPSEAGQVRAMRLAYDAAEVDPRSVTLLECHATGTARGDAAEARSSARVFAGAGDLAIGAVKANIGHAMTAAGAVGLLKVLAALEHGIRPATFGTGEFEVDDALDALRGTPLRLLPKSETWQGPRRAAVSAFGFGGNNAHVIVDSPDLAPIARQSRPGSRPLRPASRAPQVAVVGVGVRAGDAVDTRGFTDALLSGEPVAGHCETVHVDLSGLRFPPADLKAALGRQVLVFEAAREAARGLALPEDRTRVLIATACDPEIVRHTAGLREGAADAGLESAQVVGFLANMTANRISSQLGLAGASLAVGTVADTDAEVDMPALAARAIVHGEADAVVVGAVDVACPSLGDDAADAAAVLVLKRLDHARRDGDAVLDVLDAATPTTGESLLAAASRVLARYHRALPQSGRPAKPSLVVPRDASVDVAAGWTDRRPPRWHVYAGAHRAEVLAALDQGIVTRAGPARLVIAATDGELRQRTQQARRWLLGRAPKPPWAAYRDTPLSGRIAFVYPGGAAAYAGMGAQVALAFPDLVAALIGRCPQLADVAGWVYDGGPRPGDTLSCVWGAAYFAHLHTAIARDVLGIEPGAALGYSSGETTALTALGAWPDLDGLVNDLRTSPLFTRELAGPYDAVGHAWQTFLLAESADRARAASADEPTVYVMADNAPQCCTLGGEPAACARVLRRLGADHAIALDYDLAVHAPVVDAVGEQWRALHLRPTTAPPGIAFYGCARAEPYTVDAAGAAEASTALAVGAIDFRETVLRAWADGVRVFIELGPSGGCTEWIAQTLGEREHLAVAFDGPGSSDLEKLACAVAELIAAGIEVDDERLAARFAAAYGEGRETGTTAGKRLAVDVHKVGAAVSMPVSMPVPMPTVPGPVRAYSAAVGARHREFVQLLNARHTDFLAQRERVARAFASVAAAPEAAVLYDRADLEFLAVGPVSVFFGSAFAELDTLPRHTRMPGPPMLLADRVLGIEGQPASMGAGRIRTQTEVRADGWYLDPAGRMPAGLTVEAGQADLLLISWLGADLLTRGERVYRLLGCEITFHGPAPCPGETLTFDIAVDGHAEQGGVRLFFFHYDCAVDGQARLSVRNGQAGFFTDAELAATRGVLGYEPTPRPPDTRRFGPEQARAFADGRLADCFGPEFAVAGAHVRTPRPASPEFLLFDEVETASGEGIAGYARATLAIHPGSWFFEGHFADDPCMPGTLMLEGCFQLMAFVLTAAGCTLTRDGWRFEPVPQSTARISCRAQVTPSSRELTYELFVTDSADGLVADVLCSVDGVRAFLAEGLALRLVPDWPFEQRRRSGGLDGHVDPEPVARLDGTFALGLESLLACAQGRPSEMMGDRLAAMDDGRRPARLPGPPYHFMSRITEFDGDRLVAEYDVPAEAWFWEEGDGRVMPLCALLEVALQPCGWLALYTAGIPEADTELLFRNLDGQGTLGAVRRGSRILRTEVRLTDIARTGGVTIDAFEIRVWADGRLVVELSSGFGFFPPAAFAVRTGLEGPDRRDLGPSAPVQDAPAHPLIDRVTGFWPDSGRIRVEKDIAPEDWYFRAHFFQDPVQPGSLGLEAMLQALRCHLLLSGAAPRDAVFEPWLDRAPVTWRYRGQVVPADHITAIELEVTESGPGYAIAEAWLSVDGSPIYHAQGLGLRFVGGNGVDELLDPSVETWVGDHRPTWTAPALPMMSVIDRLASAATAAAGRPLGGLRNVRLARWIVLDGPPVRLRGTVAGTRVELEVEGEAAASATIVDRPQIPSAFAEPLIDPRPAESPYARGGVFHGPAFQYLVRLEVGANGARGVLDAARGTVPRGHVHQGLLDATLHVIPHDELWRWSDRISAGHVGYPYRLPSIDFFEPLPATGTVDVEARFAGFEDDIDLLPMFDVRVSREGRLLIAYRLTEILVPLGPLARLDSRERAAFLRDRRYVPGAGLSTFEDEATRLRQRDLAALDWFPGTVAELYSLSAQDVPADDWLTEIALRDHLARRAAVHPGAVGREECEGVIVTRDENGVTVRDER